IATSIGEATLFTCRAREIGWPSVMTDLSASSPSRADKPVLIRSTTAQRSSSDVLLHGPDRIADHADRTASSMSSAEADRTVVTSSSVKGVMTGKFSDPRACRHFPSIYTESKSFNPILLTRERVGGRATHGSATPLG